MSKNISKTTIINKYINKKIDAQRRGLEFDLTEDTISRLMNTKYCSYTGIKLTITPNLDNSITLDRIDPSRGYIKNNVVACSRYVNDLKSKFEYEDGFDLTTFIMMAKYNLNMTHKNVRIKPTSIHKINSFIEKNNSNNKEKKIIVKSKYGVREFKAMINTIDINSNDDVDNISIGLSFFKTLFPTPTTYKELIYLFIRRFMSPTKTFKDSVDYVVALDTDSLKSELFKFHNDLLTVGIMNVNDRYKFY